MVPMVWVPWPLLSHALPPQVLEGSLQQAGSVGLPAHLNWLTRAGWFHCTPVSMLETMMPSPLTPNWAQNRSALVSMMPQSTVASGAGSLLMIGSM